MFCENNFLPLIVTSSNLILVRLSISHRFKIFKLFEFQDDTSVVVLTVLCLMLNVRFHMFS